MNGGGCCCARGVHDNKQELWGPICLWQSLMGHLTGFIGLQHHITDLDAGPSREANTAAPAEDSGAVDTTDRI